MDGYDEDVTENPFYKAFISKAKALYCTAAENRWTICIPRKGTTTRSHHVIPQFETHIFKPSDGSEHNHYETYNNKELRVSGNFITTVKGFSDVKTVRILFEETFFNPKEEAYHILCIDQPLEGGAFAGTADPVVQNLETLQNCVDFLWPGTGIRRSKKKIDEVIDLFNSTYQRLETESIRHAIDAASAVFTRAMQTVLKEPHLRRPAAGSKAFMDNVKVAVESYVAHGLYKRIFKGLCSFLANEDAELNKITRNLADLQVKDLGVKPQLCKNIPKAKKVLSNLNKFSTPLEKLYVLKITVMTVSEIKDSSDAITADDLLAVLVFLVVKSEIPNWLANLTYMYNFHFSRSKYDEFQFYLSSIEAATEYVRSKKLNHMIGLSHTQRQKSLGKLFHRMDSNERSQGPSPVEVLFQEIKNGNAENVLRMLKRGKETSKPSNEQLCHPLCSCDSCEKLLASKRNDPMAVTVFSRDDIGSTVLHPAAEFDQENLLFKLIKLGAVVNATNYHGSTPLHIACLRGHNKAAMLLIHYGAHLNATDNDNNTPLHLAAANGHEKVTEGLVLSDSCHGKKLDINAANEHGDTSLHIAARWGFGNLVKILLQNGASVEARNKNKETPINCSANSKIQELLLNASKTETQDQNNIFVMPAEIPEEENTNFASEIFEGRQFSASSPKSDRKQRELQSLMKVVSDGDIEMVRAKLGLTNENDEAGIDFIDAGTPESGLCHPLCQCQKCNKKQGQSANEPLNQTVNMANEDGVTCLHIAALHGYDRIVGLLLKRAGAFPSCKTKVTQKTPLHLACQYNHVGCVSFLLKFGARVDIKDSSGNTPLHFCCINGHVGPAILLLQNGASTNPANKRGNTPLHESARWNCPDLISLLLHYGASINSRNKANLTPLQYAQHDEVIELLQKAEKDSEEENPDFIRVKEQPLDAYSAVSCSSTKLRIDAARTQMNQPVQNIRDDEDIEQSITESDITTSKVPRPTNNELPDDKDPVASKYHRDPAAMRQRRTTLAALFEAFEEDDIEKLRALTASIKNFDRKKSLKRVDTIDKSAPTFDQHLVQMLSIQHFDTTSLRHVESEDDHVFIMDEDKDVFLEYSDFNEIRKLPGPSQTDHSLDDMRLAKDNTSPSDSSDNPVTNDHKQFHREQLDDTEEVYGMVDVSATLNIPRTDSSLLDKTSRDMQEFDSNKELIGVNDCTNHLDTNSDHSILFCDMENIINQSSEVVTNLGDSKHVLEASKFSEQTEFDERTLNRHQNHGINNYSMKDIDGHGNNASNDCKQNEENLKLKDNFPFAIERQKNVSHILEDNTNNDSFLANSNQVPNGDLISVYESDTTFPVHSEHQQTCTDSSKITSNSYSTGKDAATHLPHESNAEDDASRLHDIYTCKDDNYV